MEIFDFFRNFFTEITLFALCILLNVAEAVMADDGAVGQFVHDFTREPLATDVARVHL